MRSKSEILAEVKEAVDAGVLSDLDLQPFLSKHTSPLMVGGSSEKKSLKLSVVDVLFYVAGLVLFSAVLSIIVQSWNDSSPFMHVILSVGVGSGMWSVAAYLLKSSQLNDIRRGLVNSLLLTGSLSIIVGGYIMSNALIGGFGEINYVAGAVTFVVLSIAHLLFDKLVKHNLVLLTGVLLGVIAIPSLIFDFLDASEASVDVWSLVVILSAGLLVLASRQAAKLRPAASDDVGTAFDWLASFVALATMYISSYGSLGFLWLLALVLGVLGIYYLSIVFHNKHLLGTASFFLVLMVITGSFRYFSGFGITTSLALSAVGLLGSAAIASNIKKKYFVKPLTPIVAGPNLVQEDPPNINTGI